MRHEAELEQRAVEALYALRADRAPDQLRENVDRLRSDHARGRTRRPASGRARAWSPAVLAPAAGLLAVAILAVALALPGGAPGSPSIVQAADLAAQGPLLAAPPPSPMAPADKLSQRVQDLEFPNWSRFGWRPTGQRIDRINGRLAVTVYYRWNRRTIAYTIVQTPALHQLRLAYQSYGGTAFQTTTMRHRVLVTWRRGGHTCILSGVGTSRQTLFSLAAWKPGQLVGADGASASAAPAISRY